MAGTLLPGITGPTQLLENGCEGSFLLAASPGRRYAALGDLCCQEEELQEEVSRLCSIREEEREIDGIFSETQQLEEPPPPEKLAVSTPNMKEEARKSETAKKMGTADPEESALIDWLVFSLAVVVGSLQRLLSTGISTLKEVITLKKKRLFTILILMTLGALGQYSPPTSGGTEARSASFSVREWSCSRLLRDLDADVDAVDKGCTTGLEAPGGAGQLSDKICFPGVCRNTLALWGEQSQQTQQLRDEVARLAAEIGTMKKEVQQMREAVSATTQMSDWALKSAGAAIDLHRSSSSSAWLCRVFWFLCAPHVLDTFVQTDASPGYCWPFQGSGSEVLIRLPAQVRPTAVTVQHASKIASPLETVSSAPRDFTVSGLDEEGEDETLLGTFTYAVHKEPTQTFPLQNGNPRAFRFLKLGIQSNWGKPGYTCIYRVQVHGKIVGSSAIGQTRVETLPH
ncbi:SUN domain-containing protein 2-like [Gavia stellata]|uniref:SUN domain-containing protein 2-like n=1 Tax=Gavia stellata TaxID=37040 RepID=UPI00289BB6D0|nr:SUN domain-containing protein 2-like [Gavia stellata]